VLRNKIYRGGAAIGAAAGWAMTLPGANCIFEDNKAPESAAVPQNNPFKDISTGVVGSTKNAWGVNWSGGVSVMPDVT